MFFISEIRVFRVVFLLIISRCMCFFERKTERTEFVLNGSTIFWKLSLIIQLVHYDY
jgi:hypothetical protein